MRIEISNNFYLYMLVLRDTKIKQPLFKYFRNENIDKSRICIAETETKF